MADFRIYLYRNLATLLSAGMPILRALRSVQRVGHRGWKKILTQIEQDIRNGMELSESMRHWPQRFPSLDLALVQVGEQTGQIAELFNSLADWYELRQKLRNAMVSGLVYPIFVLHAAAFLAPIPSAVLGGGWDSYWSQFFGILALFYVPLAVVLLARRCLPKQGFARRLFDQSILLIPVLGSAYKCLAIGRFSYFFSMMYKAGVPIAKSAHLSIHACGNQVIRSRLEGGYQATLSGNPMSEGFSKNLDSDFLQLWAVGEESGELDKTSAKLGEIYLDKARFRFEMIAQWLPKIVYFAIMGFIAFQVIRAVTTIYGRIFTDFTG